MGQVERARVEPPIAVVHLEDIVPLSNKKPTFRLAYFI